MTSTILYPSAKGAPLGPGDPVAAAIGLLRPRTVAEFGFHAAGPWAVRFDPFPHVKLGVVIRGECWLALQGHESVLLREGDFYLLGNPPSYVVASSLTEKPRAAKSLWDTAANGAVRIGPEAEEDTRLCGAQFSFDDTNASILIRVLPPLVHVRAADPRSKLLAHLRELLVAEVEASVVGGSLALDHIAQILFIHMLRAHAAQAGRPVGWLGALRDDGIGAALRAMHADVAHRWTLKELAGLSCMSRSAFAASFKNQVGSAPLEYLIEWRMSLARDALRHGTRSISELALAIGYESESAFSTAFRRVVGSSPRQFRDTGRTRLPLHTHSSVPERSVSLIEPMAFDLCVISTAMCLRCSRGGDGASEPDSDLVAADGVAGDGDGQCACGADEDAGRLGVCGLAVNGDASPGVAVLRTAALPRRGPRGTGRRCSSGGWSRRRWSGG